MVNKRTHSIERIGRSIYPLRVLGFFLFAVSIFLSQSKVGLNIDIWGASGILICLIYPHVVFLRYLKNEKRETEIRHMQIDMAFQGVMTALVGFNLIIALPYLIANSAANYALRGIKQVIKGVTLAIISSITVGFILNKDIVLDTEHIELLGPFIYLIVVTHYMGYLAYVRGNALISRKKQAEEIGLLDFLTGLNNRRSMFNQVKLNDEEPKASDTTLIMLDLDHFKQVNDNHGHDHGDAVLVQVSELIKNSLRETDIVARWGGEEFLMLLPKTNIKQGLDVAEKIRQNIVNRPICFEGVEHHITSTLGIASYGSDSNFEETIKQADKALYKGKQLGRNRIVSVDDIQLP